MFATKSPISTLQEYAQSRYLPLPHYEITQHDTGYKCIGTFEELEASTVAESKKRTKILCAERLLDLLEANLKNEEPVYLSKGHKRQKVLISQNENINYIGKLNELCVQKQETYPVYEEAGVENTKFIVQCKHQSHITRGVAVSKKQAKQLAAEEMFKRITSSESDLSLVATTTVLKHLDQEVTNITKEQSVIDKNNDVPAESWIVNNHIPSAPQIGQEESKDQVDLGQDEATNDSDKTVKVELKQAEDTEQTLMKELLRRGFKFSIEELQEKPFWKLLLKTEPTARYPAFSFVDAGASYKEAQIGVMKVAVENIVRISMTDSINVTAL